MCANIFMLINDLHTQIDKPKEFKSGAVVNESHKQSSHCNSKDRGSLESTGPNRSVRMQRLRRTRLMRHAEKNEINLKNKKSTNMVTLDRSTVTKCSS
jgi:hypothetical protein